MLFLPSQWVRAKIFVIYVTLGSLLRPTALLVIILFPSNGILAPLGQGLLSEPAKPVQHDEISKDVINMCGRADPSLPSYPGQLSHRLL